MPHKDWLRVGSQALSEGSVLFSPVSAWFFGVSKHKAAARSDRVAASYGQRDQISSCCPSRSIRFA